MKIVLLVIPIALAAGLVLGQHSNGSASGSPEEAVRVYLGALASGDKVAADAVLSSQTRGHASEAEEDEAFNLGGIAASGEISVNGSRPLDAVNVLVKVGFVGRDGTTQTLEIPSALEDGSWRVKPITKSMMTRRLEGPYPAEAQMANGTLRVAVGGLVFWKDRPSIGLDIEGINVDDKVIQVSWRKFTATLSDGQTTWAGDVSVYSDNNPYGPRDPADVSPPPLAPGGHMIMHFELGGGQQLSASGPWAVTVRDGDGETAEMKMEPAMSDALVMDRWLTLSGEEKAF